MVSRDLLAIVRKKVADGKPRGRQADSGLRRGAASHEVGRGHSRSLQGGCRTKICDEIGRFGKLAFCCHWRHHQRTGMDATTENTGGEDLREVRQRQQDHLRWQPRGLLTRHRRLVGVDHRQAHEVQRERVRVSENWRDVLGDWP